MPEPRREETVGRGVAFDVLAEGRACLGIELGSTRIKACLVDGDDPAVILAVGVHDWENEFVDGMWTYSLDAVWSGLQAAYAALAEDALRRHGVRPAVYRAIGISAMMHGYLAFDSEGGLLVPFRTWRNTTTGEAAAELSSLFGVNIPLRWSIAHLHQAALNGEDHLARLDFVTTLAGYVHWRLTGQKLIGVGDASGMFPIDPETGDYDEISVHCYNERVRTLLPGFDLGTVLPEVRSAGASAGELSAEGARLLDPAGDLRAGIPLCPPEGDAGTGMVATCAVDPRTGNVSVGTSVFAMVVLERPLETPHPEIDVVATPAGDPVAMVHCNNGASELAAWVGLFERFAQVAGAAVDADGVFAVLFEEALRAEPDAGGVLSYNHVAGEPVAGIPAGRPIVVRTPDAALTLANLMRSQLYGVFATLALGMQVLARERVAIDRLLAHGGVFRTAGVAQQMLAAAMDAPVSVATSASEGGAWGIAVLAAFAAQRGPRPGLGDYLRGWVFRDVDAVAVTPDPADAAGFRTYLDRYTAGLEAERVAATAIPLRKES